MNIQVAKKYKCRECGTGSLTVIDATDDTLTVECDSCGEGYDVETDTFGDGGVHYWPLAMSELMTKPRDGGDDAPAD